MDTDAERYVGAVDQGTTGTRFIVFDRQGLPVSTEYRKHEQIYPEPGWVEHNPNEVWRNTRRLIDEAISSSGIDAGNLEAIGVTNQRETTVVWDPESGEPLYNAVVWQDKRTNPRVEELLEEGWEEPIRNKTGLELDSYFSATKIEWLQDTVDTDDLAFGTIDSWLLYKLTGNHVTDVTNASRTMLYDIHKMEWSDELLELFGVSRDVLPEVRPSCTYFGEAEIMGENIPVTGVLGDQQAALFGQTCFRKGEAKNTYGTGSFVLMNTGRDPVGSSHGLLTTVAYQVADDDPIYALEGSIFVTGAAIEWLVDLGLVNGVEESEELAGEVESCDGVYFVPAFAGLGAPYWDGGASGTIVGIDRSTSREHLARAALEGIAFRTRDVLEAMESDSGVVTKSLRVDGGAVKNDLLCQIQADILQTEIVRPKVEETTALGAAYAAGLTTGYWSDTEELRENYGVDQTFKPDIGEEEADRKYREWSEALERSRGWE